MGVGGWSVGSGQTGTYREPGEDKDNQLFIISSAVVRCSSTMARRNCSSIAEAEVGPLVIVKVLEPRWILDSLAEVGRLLVAGSGGRGVGWARGGERLKRLKRLVKRQD
jgi:hypothetical protein